MGNTTLKKFLQSLIVVLVVTLSQVIAPQPALAAIVNPGIGASLGGNVAEAQSGVIFSRYFISIWRGVITVGGVLLLVYFLWGAVEWITAGGDSGKITKARDRLTQSMIGFIILVSAAVIIAFLGKVFFGDTINLFQLNIPDPADLI